VHLLKELLRLGSLYLRSHKLLKEPSWATLRFWFVLGRKWAHQRVWRESSSALEENPWKWKLKCALTCSSAFSCKLFWVKKEKNVQSNESGWRYGDKESCHANCSSSQSETVIYYGQKPTNGVSPPLLPPKVPGEHGTRHITFPPLLLSLLIIKYIIDQSNRTHIIKYLYIWRFPPRSRKSGWEKTWDVTFWTIKTETLSSAWWLLPLPRRSKVDLFAIVRDAWGVKHNGLGGRSPRRPVTTLWRGSLGFQNLDHVEISVWMELSWLTPDKSQTVRNLNAFKWFKRITRTVHQIERSTWLSTHAHTHARTHTTIRAFETFNLFGSTDQHSQDIISVAGLTEPKAHTKTINFQVFCTLAVGLWLKHHCRHQTLYSRCSFQFEPHSSSKRCVSMTYLLI